MTLRFLGLAAAALLALSSGPVFAQAGGSTRGNIGEQVRPTGPGTSAGTPTITGNSSGGMPEIQRTTPGTGTLGSTGQAPVISGSTGDMGRPSIERGPGVGAPAPGSR